jgi:hypothetical protein
MPNGPYSGSDYDGASQQTWIFKASNFQYLYVFWEQVLDSDLTSSSDSDNSALFSLATGAFTVDSKTVGIRE